MAGFAAPAEFAQVHIVIGVTGYAGLCELHFARRATMAGSALQPAMGACQGKVGFPGVVELPLIPGIRVMASRTVIAQ